MHVEHQLDIGADRGPHRLDDRDRLPALAAFHLQPDGAERVPFEGAEAERDGAARRIGVLLGRFRAEEPVVGIAFDPVALLAADQLEDRHAERLALDVEERRLDRAEGAPEHRARPPVGIAVHPLDEVFDRERILSDDEALELLDRRRHRLRPPLQRRLADAVDAGVGVELDEDEVRARGVGDEGLQPGDLHRPHRPVGENG